MKIMLTEEASLENGGYSWMLKDTTTQVDVTGLILETCYHNDSEEMVELTLGGFDYALGAGVVLVSSNVLGAAGFSGFSSLAAYHFKPREFTIVEA